MTKIFSIKSAAVLCVAALAMCFGAQEASAQRCGGFGPGVGGFGPSFGGGGISIGYSSGFRGVGGFGHSGFGGFGNGLSINVGRPVYSRSAFYGSGFNNFPVRYVPRGNQFGHPYGHHGYRHGHWHR